MAETCSQMCWGSWGALIGHQKAVKIYLMSPFQEDILLVQLQVLNFLVFYILWPSRMATRPVSWCDLRCVLIKYTEVGLFPNEGRRGTS